MFSSYQIEMFSRNIITISILEGSSKVIFTIAYAQILFFTRANVSIDSLLVNIVRVKYARTTLVAFIGTLAFSTTLIKLVFTLSTKQIRFQALVLVAYSIESLLLPFIIVLIDLTLKILLANILCRGRVVVGENDKSLCFLRFTIISLRLSSRLIQYSQLRGS